MAITKIGLSSNSSQTLPKKTRRSEFEEKLQAIQGVRSKQEPLKKYKSWRLFSTYICLRTYNNYFTVHVVGDLDHYEQKEAKYEEIPLGVSDIEFISLILSDFKKKE